MDGELFFAMFKKTAKFRMVLLILSVFILIIAFVVIMTTENDFNNNSAETTAKIIGYTEYAYPVLSYVVDGQEYVTNSRSQLSGYQIGDSVVIRYHKEDPSFIKTVEDSITINFR